MPLDKTAQDLLNDKNTVVIIPPFGAEGVIATKWLRKNASKVISEQRVFTELYLSSLQTDITIVTVARDYSNPIQLPQIDAAGYTHYPNRPEVELDDEVAMSQPVKVSKFWVRDNPMRPGKPDTAGILEALGKVTSPWRLEFIDRGAEKPEILQLVKA
jgi:hypothetical protein